MLTSPPGLKVLVATKPIDFRKSADGLAALAQEVFKQNPLSGCRPGLPGQARGPGKNPGLGR
jgi:transposase